MMISMVRKINHRHAEEEEDQMKKNTMYRSDLIPDVKRK